MISTYTKDFSWGKKWPKFAIFQILKMRKSPKSFNNFQKVAKNIKGVCSPPPPPASYLFCSQIWLNYFLDDSHFGYITETLKETLICRDTSCTHVFGFFCKPSFFLFFWLVITTKLKRRKGKLKAKIENILSLGVRNYLKTWPPNLRSLGPEEETQNRSLHYYYYYYYYRYTKSTWF